MSQFAGTQSVTAGGTSVTITGTFPASYQVALAPAWMTQLTITGKTASQFVATFSTPAPAGGSTLDWMVLAITGGTTTQAIAAAATSATVTGTFTVPYTVAITTGWLTTASVTTKTASSFLVTFGTPAPAGGSTFDWIVTELPVAATGAMLSDYLTDLRYLLHDLSDSIWSQTIKTSFINKALQRRDLDTQANRTLITFTLTSGLDTYNFAQLGDVSVFDVIGIALIFSGTRIVLDQRSYTELTAGRRPFTTYRGLPEAWCRYGPSSVVFAPAPSTAYSTEWDCCVFSAILSVTTDLDPLPYPWTQPVPFYAAYLAKTNEGQFDEAQEFFRQYREQIDTAMNARVGMLPTAYPQVTRI